HLGYLIRLGEDGNLEYRCQVKPLPEVDSDHITKRIAYSIAGHFTDLLKLHPECRSLCDAIRSYAGKLEKWDAVITDSSVRSYLLSLIDALKAFLPKCSCIHTASFNSTRVRLFSDASATASGYSILVGEVPLEEVSRTWSQRESIWHINRKEARSLAEALSALVTWHEERRLPISSIEAYVDSSTVYRWCKGSPLTIKTKTVERQAINRLLNAIREHVEYFAENGVKFQLKLITSEENTRADYLSRQAWIPLSPSPTSPP
ncbi:hypothetical protein FOZ63_017326, partial [Perkinsus olseni]